MEIAIILDGDGVISRLHLKGHAPGGLRGENLACAAVSLITRSVSRLVASQPGWMVDGDAAKPGSLSLVIKRRPEDTTKWLKGVTDTFLRALIDIDEEFPTALSVSIEETNNGA